MPRSVLEYRMVVVSPYPGQPDRKYDEQTEEDAHTAAAEHNCHVAALHQDHGIRIWPAHVEVREVTIWTRLETDGTIGGLFTREVEA